MKNTHLLFPLISLIFTWFSCNMNKSVEPVQLQCEFLENPLGIDVINPRLSWQLGDTSRGSKQTAYQIIVSTELKHLNTNEADIWNSGKVDSEQSHLISYAGPKLTSGTRYYWAVRTWNEQDMPSDFSSPAWWETGLLQRSDWQAQWIGNEMVSYNKTPESIGHWIWSPTRIAPNKPVYFRKSIDIKKTDGIKEAVLRLTADNQFNIHLNERYIGRGGNWQKMYSHNITPFLNKGNNILAINAMSDNKLRAGLVFSIHIHYYNGDTIKILSDNSTKTTTKRFEHWKRTGFDDLGWVRAKKVASMNNTELADEIQFIDPPKAIALRNEVNIPKKVKRARAYVSGLGNYVFYLNGERVGNDLLTPGWTHYPKKVQYQTYDVTELLNAGENALGAFIGNMWWSSGLGWDGASTYSTGPLRFILQLEVFYQNGDSEIFATDENWKYHSTPIIYNHIYHGETYDARMMQSGWNEAGFDDSVWMQVHSINENAQLVAQQAPPIEVTQILEAKTITEPSENIYVFDFGQNMVGRARLKIKGKEGHRIVMRFAELLHDDGTVAQENLRMAKATDTYILSGNGEEAWAPDFTYHGFRYVQVEGLTSAPDKSLLSGEVFHNNIPFRGAFECSNTLINKIWENITWGQRGNLVSVPTDCPQRDERLGWMGDAQIFAPTANYNMYMPSFWAKWEKDITDCQEPEGWVYDVNPAIVVDGPSKPGWGDAVVIIPWQNYLFFGDKKIIEQNYEGMKAWVDYMEDESKDYIYEWGETEWGGYGDWVAVEPSPTKPIGGIYFYYSSKLLSKMADILGKKDDAEYYAQLMVNIGEAYNEKYLDKEKMDYPGGTQTANLLPLMTGIAGEDIRDDIIANVKNNVVARDTHLTTGFLGTPYLLPILSDNGYHELAYAVATQTSYPSWGYMVENGATSMWELWNSNTEPPEGMNSRNHFAYGSVGEWFFGYLAGIKPVENKPGFKKSIIEPMPVQDLRYAKGNVETPYGMLTSEWIQEETDFILLVTIPPNTSSQIHVPVKEGQKITEGYEMIFENGEGTSSEEVTFISARDGKAVYEVPSGTYEFVVTE
jgi:alpha-L-rhamnosidase